MLKKDFSFWQNVVLLKKQGCASPATELVEFCEEMERDFFKKYSKNLGSNKQSLVLRVQYAQVDKNCLLSDQTS